MKIAVIGAAGKAGHLIAAEAKSRSHSVTAIVRGEAAKALGGTYDVLAKDLYDLTCDDLRGFDIVVDAFGTPMGDQAAARGYVSSMEHLIAILEPLPETRLLVVGGAASLYADETRSSHVMRTISEAYRAVPTAMWEAFELLQKSRVNWTYFSPAAQFDSNGKRTGHYLLGSDVSILNPEGKRYISYADYAVAMVDEFDKATFVGKRFTAVSDTSYNYIDRMTFDISAKTPFTRCGSHFGVFSGMPNNPRMRGGLNYGSGQLYLDSRRGGGTPFDRDELMQIAPTYGGQTVEFAVITSPTELIMRTAHGEIRCCFPESDLMYIKGERGLGLRLRKDLVMHEVMKRRGEKAWEGMYSWKDCCCVYNPLQGALDMHAPWNWEKLSTPVVEGFVTSDEDGCFLLSVDETEHGGIVRDHYPSYAEGLADVTADWERFLEGIAHFSPVLEEKRLEAAYILWSHIIGPAGKIQRPAMLMFSNFGGSQWQMAHHAMALRGNLPLAFELLLSPLDQASPEGQLPDFYDDAYGTFQSIKPPIHGWALKWLMRAHDLKKEVPVEKLEAMYMGLAKWADWFMTCRDDDRDGIPQYEHGDDTGLDDNSVFQYNPIMETPDLCAYLGLLYEALGDLAGMLDKEKAQVDGWYQRSKDIIDLMIKTFWRDGRFMALVNGTHEVVATDSILYFMPIVLGKRLPQEIIEKMAADIGRDGDWSTPYGLASEKLSGDDFRLTGMARGFILPPVNLMIPYGLYEAGEEKLAKKIALRYCTAIKDGTFQLTISPFAGARGPGFSGSWPASAYVALADLCSNL